MRAPVPLLIAVLALPGPPVAAQEDPPAAPAPSCDDAGEVCIDPASFPADVCRAIATAAGAQDLDPGFLARLLWRESLFDPAAVSPVGAQGIAQFMPGTAALRGLADPFNPAQAILASADYLDDLRTRFGNLGLAAAAYNAGEDRVARFVAGDGGLPRETRAYVTAITGHDAETWRNGPLPAPDWALDATKPFQDACEEKAVSGGIAARAEPEVQLRPWGVVLAALGSRDAASRQADRVVAGNPDLLGAERVDVARGRVPGMPQRRQIAQIGRETRAEAEALCQRIRAAGSPCMVLRN